MERYLRQRNLVNQEKLKHARVLIAGVGGLGTFAAAYLAMAGIGTLVLADRDRVEMSNLNRQILYTPEDVGAKKVDAAKRAISKINPEVQVLTVHGTLPDAIPENMDVDIVVDGLDSLSARIEMEKFSRRIGVPFVFGAVEGYMGMVSFIDGETKGVQAILRNEGTKEPQVLGAAAGMTAAMQSMEVVKYFSGVGDLLRNRVLVCDALSTNCMEVTL